MAELATKQDRRDGLERLTLRLTLLFGAMLVAAVGILLAAIPLAIVLALATVFTVLVISSIVPEVSSTMPFRDSVLLPICSMAESRFSTAFSGNAIPTNSGIWVSREPCP